MIKSTLYRYVSGKVRKAPDNVIATAAKTLDLEELGDVLYGFRTVNVDPTRAVLYQFCSLSILPNNLKEEKEYPIEEASSCPDTSYNSLRCEHLYGKNPEQLPGSFTIQLKRIFLNWD